MFNRSTGAFYTSPPFFVTLPRLALSRCRLRPQPPQPPHVGFAKTGPQTQTQLQTPTQTQRPQPLSTTTSTAREEDSNSVQVSSITTPGIPVGERGASLSWGDRLECAVACESTDVATGFMFVVCRAIVRPDIAKATANRPPAEAQRRMPVVPTGRRRSSGDRSLPTSTVSASAFTKAVQPGTGFFSQNEMSLSNQSRGQPDTIGDGDELVAWMQRCGIYILCVHFEV